ncbi:MAG TPA: hypothetical protein VK009_17870 [Chloroflexota bacterium]|nr:hypothetical protein [Chloroflexota bacterium]
MTSGSRWRSPADGELTWFRPPAGLLPARPNPHELLDAQAFAFGASRALESLYFPMSEIRARLIDGELHLTVAPSGTASRDLELHKKNMRDSALRFSRGVRAAWQRVRPQVEEYSAFFEAFDPGKSDLFRLKRVRANQWFAPMRAVVAPTALLLYEGIGQTPREDALAAVAEVRHEVIDRGRALFYQALDRAGPSQATPPNEPLPTGDPSGPQMFLIPEILALLADK